MIDRITILLQFPQEADPINVSSLYRHGSAHVGERLFNEDKHSVQDTFSFSLKHHQGIVDKIRTAHGNIRIIVINQDDSSAIFSGIIDPTAYQASHQINEDIVFEAVDATWRLDQPVAEAFQFPASIDAAPLKVCDYNDQTRSLFHQVCFLAGYTFVEIVPGVENHATVRHCAARAGAETYREFLDGLLSEHGLVVDDDGLGRLTTRRWTRSDPGYDVVLDADDLSIVEPVIWHRRYIPEDGVRLEWSDTQVINDALLFRDSLPVSAQGEFTGQLVAPGDCYPPDSDIEIMHQDYVERWLDRPYLERATRQKNKDLSLITTDQCRTIVSADPGIIIDAETFEWSRAQVRFKNTASEIRRILNFEIRGRALIRSSIRSITSPEAAKNPKSITSRFIFSPESAATFAQALALDIEFADFEYTFGLNRYVEPGTTVRLINQKNNIDTRAIIQDCEYDIGRPVYRYKAVGLSAESAVSSSTEASSGTAAWPYVNSIDTKTAIYTQNTPPTNNVTNLSFSSAQNPNGMVDVTITWDYIQGEIPADGFLVFYKRDITAPDDINIFRDTSVFVPASDDESYQTILTLPTRQAGAGTLPIHYRFGAVAFGTRRAGTVVHLAGVVENPDWIDKMFAARLQFDSFNFWDLGTGEMRVGNDTSYFRAVPAEGKLEYHGLDLELTESDLSTIDAEGNRLTHETSRMLWQDSVGNDIGFLGLKGDRILAENIFSEISVPGTITTVTGFANHSRWTSQIYQGKLYLPQEGGTNMQVYDFVTGTITTVAGFVRHSRYTSQIYQGKLYLPQEGGTNMQVYDFVTGTITTVTGFANHSRWTSQIYQGKLYLPQSNGTNMQVYDFVTGTITTVAGFASHSRITSQIYQGKLYLPQSNGTEMQVYDFVTGTITTVTGFASHSRWASQIYQGKLYLPQSNGTEMQVYDFVTGTITTVTGFASHGRITSQIYQGKLYLPQSGGTEMQTYSISEYAQLGAGIIESGSNSRAKFSDGSVVPVFDFSTAQDIIPLYDRNGIQVGGIITHTNGNIYIYTGTTYQNDMRFAENSFVIRFGGSTRLQLTDTAFNLSGNPITSITTTSVRDNTTFPIGTVLIVYTDVTNFARNAGIAPRLQSDFYYATTGTGPLLSGTWRCSGTFYDSNGGNVYFWALARRVS